MYYKNNMRNAAYTKEYLTYREINEVKFFIEEDTVQKDIIKKEISDGYHYVEEKYSNIKLNEGIIASKVQVYFEDKIIYKYKCLYSVIFLKLIKHSNGKNYLIFNRELYGYSVVEIETMKEFHYYPQENMKKGGETFIWTEVFYNFSNDFMAVFGCYWAGPYFYILVDFSNPFKESPYLELGDLSENPENPDGHCWDCNDFVFIDYDTQKKITIKEDVYKMEHYKLVTRDKC